MWTKSSWPTKTTTRSTLYQRNWRAVAARERRALRPPRHVVDNLIDVIRRVTVRSIVAKAAQENIIKRMATGSIKAEMHKKGELYKVYYVGSGTQDNLGSFMLLRELVGPVYLFSCPGTKAA